MVNVPHVVLDTNVLISAAGWNGPSRQLFQACREGRLQLVTSLALIDELRRSHRERLRHVEMLLMIGC